MKFATFSKKPWNETMACGTRLNLSGEVWYQTRKRGSATNKSGTRNTLTATHPPVEAKTLSSVWGYAKTK